ncbi:hypothetical protein GCM10010246_02810 [Streptomyces cuspidosporus]|uniref:Uncharacterized protein n=1 Tax=Streptomyces cuspidosporus TaxID=66882 RepID=A0ABN3FAN3_9ACTN
MPRWRCRTWPGIAEFVDEAGHRGIGGVAGEGGVRLHGDLVAELGGVGDPVQRGIRSLRPEEGPAREIADSSAEMCQDRKRMVRPHPPFLSDRSR